MPVRHVLFMRQGRGHGGQWRWGGKKPTNNFVHIALFCRVKKIVTPRNSGLLHYGDMHLIHIYDMKKWNLSEHTYEFLDFAVCEYERESLYTGKHLYGRGIF